MAKKKEEYGNESIKSLKGADRVRKRPAVIFGSDGVEGCAHSIFEIVSNSIDEARDGHGNKINVTLYPEKRAVHRPPHRLRHPLETGHRCVYRYQCSGGYLQGYAAPPGRCQ